MIRLFGIERPVIAMLHLPASPGVEGFTGIAAAIDRLKSDLDAYLAADVDALLLENMHDFPCIREGEMGPEIPAYLTRLALEVRRLADERTKIPLPIGLQVLFAANRTALAVVQAADMQFIRAEAWTHAHVSDKGIIDAQGGRVKRFQHRIGANSIQVFTDIKKKHASHALTADIDLGEVAELLALHRSDGAIVTGTVTGQAPTESDLKTVREHTDLPLLIGSGIELDNIERFYPLADAFIVGSSFKSTGQWDAPVDRGKALIFMERVRELRRR
ncbi:MAG: BtpA/SgcQ family protein [bacterium]|nr:BtpA/SgcQ family protein [bacterium]